MALLINYSLRSLWKRGNTTIAAVLGIAMVVFVLSASRMLAHGMRETMIQSGHADQAIVLQHDKWAEQESRMDQAVLGRVAAAPGIRRNAAGQVMVAAETVAHILLRRSGDANEIGTVQVRGVSDNVLEIRPETRLIGGRLPSPGTDEAAVGRGLVDRYEGLSLGAHVNLGRKRQAKVVGVFETSGTAHESEVWVDRALTQAAFGMDSVLSSITVRLESEESLVPLSEALMTDQEAGFSVERESAYYGKVSDGMADAINALGTIEALIFSMGAVLAAMVTLYASVAQRTTEIGVLKAMGFSQAHVVFVFLTESLVLCAAGALIGLIPALAMPWWEFSTVNFATRQEVAFRFVPSADVLLFALGAGVALGAAAGVLPAVAAARVSPNRAMRA